MTAQLNMMHDIHSDYRMIHDNIPWNRDTIVHLPPSSSHRPPNIPHYPTTCYQATKSLAVSEGITRSYRSSGSPARERSWQPTFSFVSDPVIPLNQFGLICQGWVDVHLVESPGHHWQQQHHRGQHGGEPEGCVCHCSGQGTNMLPLDDIVVEECEDKVEDDTAPDSDVVPHCPV